MRRSLAGMLLLALVAAPVAAGAERQLVDRVVAMVDGEAILLSDVLQQMNLVRLQRNLGELDEQQQKQLYESVLQDMIDDQLLVAEAKVKKYEVGDQDLRDAVDETIRSIKERLGGEERYQEELQKQGLAEAELRDLQKEQKRREILASRIIAGEVRRQVSVSDDQVRGFFETKRDSLPPELLRVPEKLRLAHILVAPSVDPKKRAAAEAKIAEAERRLAAGEDFGKVATEMSEWPTAKRGGFLGNFRYGEFASTAFDEAVSKLEPGQVSGIIETRFGMTSFGLQIVKLESRQGDEMTARHIVVKLPLDEEALVAAFEKAEELRARALAGEGFEDLARANSDDPNTRDKGGVVDQEWNQDDLLPEFRAALDSVPAGGVSTIVRSQAGFFVFKVLARTAGRVASFDDIKDDLRRHLEQRELEKRYRLYLADLRKKFIIDRKG